MPQIPARRDDDALFPPPIILNAKNPFDREKIGIALDTIEDDESEGFFDGSVLNISLPVREGEIAQQFGDGGLDGEVGEAVRGAIDEALKVKDFTKQEPVGQVLLSKGEGGRDQPVVRVEVSDDGKQRILINARSDEIGIYNSTTTTKDGITGILSGFSGEGITRETTARPGTVKFELEDAVVVSSTPPSIEEEEFPNNIFDPAEYEYDDLSAVPADTDDEGAPFDNRILGGRSSANIVQATVVEDLGRANCCS